MRSAVIASLSFGLFCFGGLPNANAQGAFRIAFKWCSGSPQFTLSGVPKGTAKLNFRMVDFQAPAYPHGGGEIAYSNQKTIACGAMNSTYTGPSPPRGPHTYEWTVKAIGTDGGTLGEAKAQRKFPE